MNCLCGKLKKLLYRLDCFFAFLPLDAMLARYMLSSCVRPSVRPSAPLRHKSELSATKTVKPMITQTKPYDSPGTLVF